jgi:hypothetical protein
MLNHSESISQVGLSLSYDGHARLSSGMSIFTREMDVLASSPSSVCRLSIYKCFNILKWIQNFFE